MTASFFCMGRKIFAHAYADDKNSMMRFSGRDAKNTSSIMER